MSLPPLYECPYGHVGPMYYDFPHLPEGVPCHKCYETYKRYWPSSSADTVFAYPIVDPAKVSIYYLSGAAACQDYIAEEKKKKYPRPCTYHEPADREARWHEVHAEAVCAVRGPSGSWNLCQECSGRRRFRRYDRMEIIGCL